MNEFTKLNFYSPQFKLECEATKCKLTSNEYELNGEIVFNTELTAEIGSGNRLVRLMIKADELKMSAVHEKIGNINVNINDWTQATVQGTILQTDFNFESNIGNSASAELTVKGPNG